MIHHSTHHTADRRPRNTTAALFCILIAISATTLCAQAQQTRATNQPAPITYGPVGTPVDPKVPARWNRFYDHAAATRLLQQLAAAHPRYFRLVSLGQSFGGREMWLVTLTDQQQGQPDTKPAFWIDGGIHANEIQGVEVTLYTAWWLAEQAEHLPRVAQLLKDRTFYILPMMSPDSRDAHMYEPNTTHSPRSGQIPVDDDRDGLINEDPADDLDGDGHITQMRIADPNGPYKQHEKYPNHMVRVRPDEKGTHRMLGNEGIDNDDDGRVNEDGDGYYDPNRDWAWLWEPDYVQNGAHRYPFSINENRLVADFVAAHPNIAGAQSYHNTAGMILRGPGAADDRYQRSDIAVFDRIGEHGESVLPGYRYLNVLEGLYAVWGGEFDYFYQMLGITAFTNELFTPSNFFREESGDNVISSDETAHRFTEHLLMGEGVVPWHTVQHPQLGTIEVGGFTKNWIRQAPAFLLEEECHRNMMFTLYHAEQMPLVRIQSVTMQDADDGLSWVTATVENQRITPTRLAVDVQRSITRPDHLAVTGPNLQVILALTNPDPLFLNATEQKRNPQTIQLDTVPGNGVTYARWLVRATGPVTVTLDSVKGGTDSVTLELIN